jgi:hypothetical protein
MDGEEELTQPHAVPPDETGPVPVDYVQAERHVFGLAPGDTVAALGLVCLVLACILLAAGHLAAGLVTLAVALGLGSLWIEQARRLRSTRFDRAALATASRARELGGFAGLWARTWSVACTRAARFRLDAALLARRRRPLLVELGTATYEGDGERVAAARARLVELDRRIDSQTRRARASVARARRRSRVGRLAVQRTAEHRPVS